MIKPAAKNNINLNYMHIGPGMLEPAELELIPFNYREHQKKSSSTDSRIKLQKIKYMFPKFMHPYILFEQHDLTHNELRLIEKYSAPISKDKKTGKEKGKGFLTVNRQVCWRLLRIEASLQNKEPVLITGDSGTGKENVAHIIHEFMGEKGSELITINCAAFPETLLESELFGHVKGAFTGASNKKIGIFDNDSVIFLDEIDKASLQTQARLLRVIENKKMRVIGTGNETDTKYKRLIFATNKSLQKQIEYGLFLPDLYNRIAVNTINLPSLNERGLIDFELLFHYFVLKEIDGLLEKHKEHITTEVLNQYPFEIERVSLSAFLLRLLQLKGFEGNVRAIRNQLTVLISWMKMHQNEADLYSLEPFEYQKKTKLKEHLKKSKLAGLFFMDKFYDMAWLLWEPEIQSLEKQLFTINPPIPERLSDAKKQFEQFHIQQIRSTSRNDAHAIERLGIAESTFYKYKKELFPKSDNSD
jgi:DNA-binding NtrC family response regulator